MRDSNERVYLRSTNHQYVGNVSLHGSHSSSRWTVMDHPILLGSTLTDGEFKHLCNLTKFPKCPGKDISYFWVLSDLSIGCRLIRPHQDFSNCDVLTMNEFLAYIKEQKLSQIL